jgi:hypothetical protein
MLALQVNLRTEGVYIQSKHGARRFHGPVGSATPGSDLGEFGGDGLQPGAVVGLVDMLPETAVSFVPLSNIQVQEGGNDPEHGDEPHP